MPKRLGGNFLIGGFDIVEGKELVVYNLDVEQVQQAVDKKELTGRSTEVPEDNGDGVLIDSPSARVLAYWTTRPTPTCSSKWRGSSVLASSYLCRPLRG